MIEGHGDDLWKYEGLVKYNFSTNIHSCFDHSKLMRVLAEAAASVESYPEPQPRRLENAVAEMVGCNGDEVFVSNGATDSIYTVAMNFAGKSSAILIPTFREYQDACAIHSHKITFITNLSELQPQHYLLWLCNPNNPTGNVIPAEILLEMAHNHPEKIFIIDQAYSDYTLLPTITPRQAADAGNIILLGSLTKRFAVPGLRIGYAIASAPLISSLKKWRMPWPLSGPSIAGALYLIKNRNEYNIDAESLHSEALRISDNLRKMGIKVEPSDCNFILCKLPQGKAAEMKDRLVENYGILIRDASNFEGLTDAHFRIAAQDPSANNLLINAIGKWLDI